VKQLGLVSPPPGLEPPPSLPRLTPPPGWHPLPGWHSRVHRAAPCQVGGSVKGAGGAGAWGGEVDVEGWLSRPHRLMMDHTSVAPTPGDRPRGPSSAGPPGGRPLGSTPTAPPAPAPSTTPARATYTARPCGCAANTACAGVCRLPLPRSCSFRHGSPLHAHGTHSGPPQRSLPPRGP